MKTIYFKLLFLMMLLPIAGFSQSTVEGVVLDSKSSKPIAGVNVVVKGGSNVSTQDNGAFKLVKVNKGDKITFSFVGYQNQTIEYTGQKNLTVMLAESSNTLEAVTVQVGYGSVKKKDLTGSVATLSSKEFNKGPIVNAADLIKGRVAGVDIQSSGTPGDGAGIKVREGSSLNAGNDPLVVVDGMPVSGGIGSINPNDIETYTILKDASATAIYGNRGANGVIMITTKRASSKKGVKVDFNTFTAYNTLQKKIDVYSGDEYRNLITTLVPSKVPLLGNANTDWQSEIFRNTYSTGLNVQVSANPFEKLNFPMKVSLSNNEDNGILLTSKATRTTGNFAISPTFFDKHLTIDASGTYSYTYRRNADQGAIGNAINYDPTQSVYDAASPFGGYTEWVDPSTGNPRGSANPVSLLLSRRDIGNHHRFFGNASVEYKFHFLPELKAKVVGGVDNLNGEGATYVDPNSRIGYDSNLPAGQRFVGSESYSDYQDHTKYTFQQLQYVKKFGKLSVDVMAGHEYTERSIVSYGTPNLKSLSYYPNAVFDTYTAPLFKLESYISRANLGWNDNKFMLTLNFRRDGSSKISPINMWKNFLGYAFAWRLNQEKFLKDSKVISDLKLRLGYGENGNQDIGLIDWFKRYNTSNNAYYQFGNQFVVISKPVGYNENLKWESVSKYNIGLDYGFFGNRIKGNIDVFKSVTNDLFSQVAEGALQNLRILGTRNVGSLESRGVEFAVNVTAVKKENFNLDFNYNFYYSKIKITDLFNDNLSVGGVGLGGFVQRLSVGYAPYTFWVYQQVYDQNGKPIEGVYVDRNKDGVVDSNDKYNYKQPNAPVTMGLMINSTFYKRFEFSMLWRAKIGNYIYDQVNADRANLNFINNTVDNTLNNATYDFENTLFSSAKKESDYFVKNGSFVKLDNLTAAYTFNNTIKSIKYLKVSASVQNVLIITKYKNLDPENYGIDGLIYPRARIYSIGINATF